MTQNEINLHSIPAEQVNVEPLVPVQKVNRLYQSVGTLILRNLFYGEKIDTIPDPKDESNESSINALGDAHNDVMDLVAMSSTRKTMDYISPSDFPEPTQEKE